MAVARYVKYESMQSVTFFEYLLCKPLSRLFFTSGFIVLLILHVVNIGANTFLQAKTTSLQTFANNTLPNVQGSVLSAESTPTITPTPIPLPSPEPTRTPRQKSYKIAVFGDSMIDTMGGDLSYLKDALVKKYRSTKFELYNYGQGAQNVEEGLQRFSKPFSYDGRNYPSISQLGADIIIIGSFAYNPFSPHDRDRHWLTLTKLVEETKKTGADVYMLAEIAPLRADFGKGPNGVNWSYPTTFEHSERIIQHLENSVALAEILNVNLINIFEKSIVSNQKEGKREYVNPSDGIHPSVEGNKFTADEITKTLILD